MVAHRKLPELNRNKSSRYYIDPSELDPRKFEPEATLTGSDDYPRWYRKMKAYLAAREKLRFADGSTEPPAKHKRDEYEAWKNCDDLVVKWILRSLTAEIATSIKESIKDDKIDNAAVVWRKLKRYSPGDLLIVSQFLRQIHTFEQGNLDVPKFLAKIYSLWTELDILRPPPKKCSCGALEKLKKQREEEILGVFLKGLNDRYHATRSRILRRNPLPSPSEACSIIVQAHNHRIAPSVR